MIAVIQPLVAVSVHSSMVVVALLQTRCLHNSTADPHSGLHNMDFYTPILATTTLL